MSIWTPSITWPCPEGRRPALAVTPGFVLMLAVLFYLDEGVGMLGWSLLACALHEGGHLLAARLAGGRPVGLRLSAIGAELTLDPGAPLSYGGELVVALAGPAVNLLLAWAAGWGRLWLLAGVSLTLGVFNLLPVQGLDGGRVLWCLTGMAGRAPMGQTALRCISACIAGGLLGAGLILLRLMGNVTLAVTAVWLLAGLLPGRRGR